MSPTLEAVACAFALGWLVGVVQIARDVAHRERVHYAWGRAAGYDEGWEAAQRAIPRPEVDP